VGGVRGGRAAGKGRGGRQREREKQTGSQASEILTCPKADITNRATQVPLYKFKMLIYLATVLSCRNSDEA